MQPNLHFALIDNYDSFVYNLYHLICKVEPSATVTVFRNNTTSIEELQKLGLSAIFLSPGPCTPKESGICPDVVRKFSGATPIFGVCLGYQVICEVFGGDVVVSGLPMHGKLSNIHHSNTPLYSKIPKNFKVTRYHSLIVDRQTLPKCFTPDSLSDEGHLMSVSHNDHKTYGVQYHPESIGSEFGPEIIRNFLSISQVK